MTVSKMQNSCLVAAAIAGFTGVALGAFGAHALEPLLESNGRIATWETAVLYHLIHAVALLALGFRGMQTGLARWVARLWVAGIAVFSGSLYLLSLTGITVLGAITPLGGLALLGGWGTLLWLRHDTP